MSIKRILILGLAATALSTVAWADTYQCGASRCYDDQADETRRLNLLQLENPGAGLDAVPGQDDADGSYDDSDEGPYAGDPYGPEDEDGDDYGPPPDGSYAPEDAEPPYGSPNGGVYPGDDDCGDGYSNDTDDDDGPCSDEEQ